MHTPSHKVAKVEAAPTSFPLWPFACMAYADHMGRDYRQHLAKLGQAATGVEMMQTESLYDAHLLSDMARAFYNLALAPYSALWAVAAGDAPSLLFEGLDSRQKQAEAEALPHGQPGID